MASVDRTAYPRLPSAISGRELAEVFTPTAGEVAWACAMAIEPATRLLLLVLLKCYQRLGYFPPLDQVLSQVTEHVHARAVEAVSDRIGPSGRHSERMVRRCRELVRQRTGAVWDPYRIHAVAETAMRHALQGKDNPADVIGVALGESGTNRGRLRRERGGSGARMMPGYSGGNRRPAGR